MTVGPRLHFDAEKAAVRLPPVAEVEALGHIVSDIALSLRGFAKA